MNFFWLAVFVVVGFPLALGIELFLRASKRPSREVRAMHDEEFMPMPSDSGIARRMREPAHAAMSEPE